MGMRNTWIWNKYFSLWKWNVFITRRVSLYIEYIIKKHETLSAIPPIHVYINRINNRLVFKIRDRYKLELQTTETMKLFSSTKK